MAAEPPDRIEPPFEREAAAGKTIGARLLRAAERVRILREQIEGARARHRSVDVGLAAVEKDSEIGGSLLAGALSYRLFVFLLPYTVLLVGGVGLYADATGANAEDIADDVGLTEIVAEQVGEAASDTARWWVILVTLPIAAYALGQLFRAIAIVHALAFEGSGRAVRVLPRAVGLFGAAVIGQSVVVNAVGFLHDRLPLGVILGTAIGVAAVSGLWLFVTSLLPYGTSTLEQRVPGALLYGVGTLALYLFNALLIGRLVQSRADTYGALGAAAALLFSMYLTGRLIVGAAGLSAVVAGRAALVRKP